jgi:hypothetical protein
MTFYPAIRRPATRADAALLYAWRIEDEQGDWYDQPHTSYPDHVQWLNARINNPLINIWIWEADDQPVGMVRIDSNGELAFHGDDLMLRAAISAYGGRLKATVDEADPRVQTLEKAGFVRYPAVALTAKP